MHTQRERERERSQYFKQDRNYIICISMHCHINICYFVRVRKYKIRRSRIIYIRASILNTSHTHDGNYLINLVCTYEAYIYDNIYYTRVISTLSSIIKYTLILKHIYIPYASSPYPDPPYPEPS